jgi:hypothetical protein
MRETDVKLCSVESALPSKVANRNQWTQRISPVTFSSTTEEDYVTRTDSNGNGQVHQLSQGQHATAR